MSFLLYGANGYTGKLILNLALKEGLKPVIAGRSEAKIKPLAEKYGLKFLIFGLDNHNDIVQHIKKFPLVLHCAGPFSKTARPMVEACLEAKTHYLDITGEIAVFELVKSYHKKALENSILLLSGVGFDVVPTDCMATYLHEKLPDARRLELAFMSSGGGISHGTMSTMVENLGESGAVREKGKIVAKPIGHKSQWIDFGKKKRFTMTIPWGDISTAFHSTGILNIEVYTAIPKKTYRILKLQPLFNPLLQTDFVKKLIQNYIDKKITGPSQDQNKAGRSAVWGKVANEEGKTVEALLEGPESYQLTAETALLITKKVLSDNVRSGYHTPAGLFGYKLILEVEGTSLNVVNQEKELDPALS